MLATSFYADPVFEQAKPNFGSQTTSAWKAKFLGYFLSAIVIGLGMFFGAILALFIGLFSGWIHLDCLVNSQVGARDEASPEIALSSEHCVACDHDELV